MPSIFKSDRYNPSKNKYSFEKQLFYKNTYFVNKRLRKRYYVISTLHTQTQNDL